jgi:hypothetical protein
LIQSGRWPFAAVALMAAMVLQACGGAGITSMRLPWVRQDGSRPGPAVTALVALNGALPELRRGHPAGRLILLSSSDVDEDGTSTAWILAVWDPAAPPVEPGLGRIFYYNMINGQLGAIASTSPNDYNDFLIDFSQQPTAPTFLDSPTALVSLRAAGQAALQPGTWHLAKLILNAPPGSAPMWSGGWSGGGALWVTVGVDARTGDAVSIKDTRCPTSPVPGCGSKPAATTSPEGGS